MSSMLPARPRNVGPRRSVAIVASLYHEEFVRGLISHARRELEEIAPGSVVNIYEVPGAFEVPFMVQEVAKRGAADVVIAFGVIMAGQTAHAELIGRSVTDALMRIGLETRVPVVHEVLLVQNEEQARERCLGDEINRGTEAARVAVRMVMAISGLPRR